MGKRGLDIDVAAERYQAERLQGELIGSLGDRAWGWSTSAGRERAERRADFLIKAAGLRPGIRCLELGCGTGEFTARLAASGCELTAVELSERTAQICRERIGDAVEVVVGNIETGEGLDGREFDAMAGVSVLHHVNMDRCFTATLSKLRPGGRFAFSEPNLVNPQVWLERHVPFVRKLRHVTPHETAFRAADLRRRFEAAGFVVDQCEPFDFLHPSTPRLVLPVLAGFATLLEQTPLRAIAGSIRIAGSRPGSD